MEIDTRKEELKIKDDDLFRAAESGDASTFKSLSQEQLSRALSLRNEDSRSLLHVAASSAQSEVGPFLKFSSSLFGCWEIVGKWKRVVKSCLESFLFFGLCWCYFTFVLQKLVSIAWYESNLHQCQKNDLKSEIQTVNWSAFPKCALLPLIGCWEKRSKRTKQILFGLLLFLCYWFPRKEYLI